MKIILIGFMGSGKSSVAKKLAPLFDLPIFEMDDFVLQKTEMKTMQEVFAEGEELLLRETEIAIAREYAALDNGVISTGGGVVLNKIVLDYLKQRAGKVFFLNASFKAIAERLALDVSRPLFQGVSEAEALYDFRQPLYMKYADHVVDVGEKTVEDVVQEIAGNVKHSAQGALIKSGGC